MSLTTKDPVQKAGKLAAQATSAFTDAVAGLNEANRLLEEAAAGKLSQARSLEDEINRLESEAAENQSTADHNARIIDRIEGLFE